MTYRVYCGEHPLRDYPSEPEAIQGIEEHKAFLKRIARWVRIWGGNPNPSFRVVQVEN